MEITDLVMLLILESLHENGYKNIKAIYGYDAKRLSIGKDDYFEVYSRGQNMDWLGIGGSNYRITENVSVVVRSKTKKNYMLMREIIKSLFTGDVFVFNFIPNSTPLALVKDEDFDEIDIWGVYVARVHLLKDSSFYPFNRGDYVEFVDGDDVLMKGWFYGIIGEYMYIILRSNISCLIRPIRINEDSMSLRKMYEATFDIEGTLIECVNS